MVSFSGLITGSAEAVPGILPSSVHDQEEAPVACRVSCPSIQSTLLVLLILMPGNGLTVTGTLRSSVIWQILSVTCTCHIVLAEGLMRISGEMPSPEPSR